MIAKCRGFRIAGALLVMASGILFSCDASNEVPKQTPEHDSSWDPPSSPSNMASVLGVELVVDFEMSEKNLRDYEEMKKILDRSGVVLKEYVVHHGRFSAVVSIEDAKQLEALVLEDQGLKRLYDVLGSEQFKRRMNGCNEK